MNTEHQWKFKWTSLPPGWRHQWSPFSTGQRSYCHYQVWFLCCPSWYKCTCALRCYHPSVNQCCRLGVLGSWIVVVALVPVSQPLVSSLSSVISAIIHLFLHYEILFHLEIQFCIHLLMSNVLQCLVLPQLSWCFCQKMGTVFQLKLSLFWNIPGCGRGQRPRGMFQQ